jgi:hypothetical protein
LLAISVADMTRPTGIDLCDNKSLRRKDFPDRRFPIATMTARGFISSKLNFLSLSDTPPVVPVIITIFQNRYHFESYYKKICRCVNSRNGW